MNQNLTTNTMKTLTLALGLTAALATSATAGSTTWISAAGGSNYCDEHPDDPICHCPEDGSDEGCYNGGEDEFASFMVKVPPQGISRTRFERYAPLPDGDALVGARSAAGGNVLCWGSNSAHVVNGITGEEMATILVPADGIAPKAIDYNEQRRTYEVLRGDGSIVEIDPVGGTKTEILPPWTQSSGTRDLSLLLRMERGAPGWLTELVNFEPGWSQLYKVERIWGTTRLTPVGQARQKPFVAIGLTPDWPFVRGVAVDSGGSILVIDEDLTVRTLGTFPEAPSCATISQDGSQAFALTAEGKLYEADLQSGVVSLVGSSPSLKYRIIITTIERSTSPTRVVPIYNAANKTLSFVSEKGAALPNLRSMKVADIIGVEPAETAQLRMVTGKFAGELVGDADDTQLALTLYDPSLTSTAAATVDIVSLRCVDNRGYPAVLKKLQPYGSMNRAGATLATIERQGGPDVLVTGAGPSDVYGPHVLGFRMEKGEMARKFSFYAFGTLKNGVNVATGDVDGDGNAEVITGAGPGRVFGAHVRAFLIDAVTLKLQGPMAKVNFFAFESKYGASVAAGDVNGDGQDDIIVGAGPAASNGAQVRAFTLGQSGIKPLSLNFMFGSTGGAKVSVGNVDDDPADEVIATRGSDPSGAVYLIDRATTGAFDATSLRVVATDAAAGSIGTASDYAGATSPLGWPLKFRVWRRLVTHLWVDYLVDADNGCYGGGTAAFHLGDLPGGGAALDAQGKFSFTVPESTGLPANVVVDGQLVGNTITGTMTFTYQPCGWTRTFTFSATR